MLCKNGTKGGIVRKIICDRCGAEEDVSNKIPTFENPGMRNYKAPNIDLCPICMDYYNLRAKELGEALKILDEHYDMEKKELEKQYLYIKKDEFVEIKVDDIKREG